MIFTQRQRNTKDKQPERGGQTPQKGRNMKLTDTNALNELKKARSSELDEAINSYPEDERDGRTDLQMLADELSYILSNFEESGHVLCDDLAHAKEVLYKTKYGKVIPLWQSTLTPVYSKSDIEIAKSTINEYKRLQSCMKRLNKQGYYGKWL